MAVTRSLAIAWRRRRVRHWLKVERRIQRSYDLLVKAEARR